MKYSNTSLLTNRVNTLTALPDGSTTNDARLEDICVGYDNNVYDNPGESVRTQISDLHNKLINFLDALNDYYEIIKLDKYGCLTYTDPLNVFLNPNLTSYYTNIIHVIPGDIYKYSGHGDNQAYSVFWFNKNMQELSYEQYVTSNDTYVTITTPSNAAYAVFQSYGIELKLTNITRSITSIYETTNNIDKKINDVNMRFINHINQLKKTFKYKNI